MKNIAGFSFRALALLVSLGATPAVLSDSAWAQSSPNIADGQLIHGPQWNGFFSGKADATGGTLTNPTIGGNASINTTNSNGYQFNGASVLRMFGSGTDAGACGLLCTTLVGTGAGALLDPRDKMDTFIGWYAAGQMNTGANSGESTCVGYKACYAIIAGSYNTALGLNALGTNANAPTGAQVHDIAIGTDSFRQAYDVNQYNIGIGVTSFINSGDTNSIGIGENTLPGSSTSQTTGVYNIAIGINSMSGGASGGVGGSETSASHNVAIGPLTFTGVTSGGNNVVIGFEAGQSMDKGSSNVFIGQKAGNAYTGNGNNTYVGNGASQLATTETGSTVLGFNVGSSNARTGSGNVLIGTSSATDTPTATGANGSNALNIANVITGMTSTGTNPKVCVIGMQCVLGVLRSANFNSTADQAIVISPLTAGVLGTMSSATKYVITEIDVMNCSASLSAAQGGFYTAASKGGTVIGATTTAYATCASATTRQKLAGVTNMDTNSFTAASLFLSLTTAQGTAATGDVYVMGYVLN